ncbi:MAG: LysR family transcriptional regulator [Aquisalimonadaceae bacterium]
MDIKGLDLNLLKVFDAIYTHRNLTRAGDSLGISQPAVSRAMQRLREAFGDMLFERVPQGMTPTRKAEMVARHIQSALDNAQTALHLGKQVKPQDLDVAFRLGTNDYLSLLLLPRIAQRVRVHAPNVRLIAPNVGHTCVQFMLDSAAIDAAIVSEEVAGSRYESMPLFTEEYVCIAGADNRRVPAAGLDLDTFVALDHLLVSHATAERGWVDSTLQGMGRSRRVAMSIPHFSVAPSIIVSTDLICTLPKRIAHLLERFHAIRILPLPIRNHRHLFHLVWLRRYGSGSHHSWFREEIAAVSREL